MKKSLKVLTTLVLVIGIALVGGCTSKTQIIEDITPKQAFDMLESCSICTVIIDVRTPEEFAEGYIENAINLDYKSESFINEINKLDKDGKYMVYCKSGGRSRKAVDIMAELGFKEVYNILDGITGWESEGLPVVLVG